MHIRRANTEDAPSACAVIRQSIVELCHADHGGDEFLLGKWLSNKTVENVTQWTGQDYVVVAEEEGTLLGVAAMNDRSTGAYSWKPYPSASGDAKCCSHEGGSAVEQITNPVAFGSHDDRLSALLARVSTALWRRGGMCAIPCCGALA